MHHVLDTGTIQTMPGANFFQTNGTYSKKLLQVLISEQCFVLESRV